MLSKITAGTKTFASEKDKEEYENFYLFNELEYGNYE